MRLKIFGIAMIFVTAVFAILPVFNSSEAGIITNSELTDNFTYPTNSAIVDEVDLFVQKSAFPTTVVAGEQINYSIFVTNNSISTPATGVMATDTLPPEVSFVSADAGCTEAAGIVTCVIGALGFGQSTGRTIVVSVDPATPNGTFITNNVEVQGDQVDPNLLDNSASILVEVVKLQPECLPGDIVIEPPFCTIYEGSDLGPVPGLPPPYGGLTFLFSDPNTLLIGGEANQPEGKLYSIGVVRDASGHITGFSGTATVFAEAAYNDGGINYGPGNVLFLSRWPVNEIGQTKPGSAITDKIIDLGPLGVTPSPGGLNFVPAGFPGAGQLKIVSWEEGDWYTLDFAPDGGGTFDITNATLNTQIEGGPEGFIYVPPGSPMFSDFDNMLVSEFSSSNVTIYDDGSGNPIPATRTRFLAGLAGAEGALIDPLTGDFLFSTFTFVGGSKVIVVQGFAIPPQADLSITKMDDPDPVIAGEQLTYTIGVTNNSTSTLATGVNVTDTLPEEVSFESASAGCTESAGVVVCNIGDLAIGETIEITIVGTVNPLTEGIITNTASAEGDQVDPDFNNNTVSEDTTVKQLCVLDLSLAYENTTLTLGFELGTQKPALWGTWMVVGTTFIPLWTFPISTPIDPPGLFSLPIPGFPSIGKIGFLTLLIKSEGIICSDWETIDTGGPSSVVPSTGKLRELFQGATKELPLR